jgi:hypothetical protein
MRQAAKPAVERVQQARPLARSRAALPPVFEPELQQSLDGLRREQAPRVSPADVMAGELRDAPEPAQWMVRPLPFSA